LGVNIGLVEDVGQLNNIPRARRLIDLLLRKRLGAIIVAFDGVNGDRAREKLCIGIRNEHSEIAIRRSVTCPDDIVLRLGHPPKAVTARDNN